MTRSCTSNMNLKPVRFDDLLEAFEFVNAGHLLEHQAYLCTETGVIHYHSDLVDLDEPLPEDVEDFERYIPIPHKSDVDLGRSLALGFAKQELADDVDDVYSMFRRKGAYARFKELLVRRNKLEQWYEYEERRKKEVLREWCQANGVQVASSA